MEPFGGKIGLTTERVDQLTPVAGYSSRER
jgi:hypothetical protein